MRNALLISLLVTGLAAGQASAHARLLRATPKAGSTVAQPPKELRLFFSETIVPNASSATLTAAGGAKAPLGRLATDPKDPRVVVLPVAGKLSPGRYHVEWRMKTADTHTMDGDFFFSVKP